MELAHGYRLCCVFATFLFMICLLLTQTWKELITKLFYTWLTAVIGYGVFTFHFDVACSLVPFYASQSNERKINRFACYEAALTMNRWHCVCFYNAKRKKTHLENRNESDMDIMESTRLSTTYAAHATQRSWKHPRHKWPTVHKTSHNNSSTKLPSRAQVHSKSFECIRKILNKSRPTAEVIHGWM